MNVPFSPKTKYRESGRSNFSVCFTLAPGRDSSDGLDSSNRVLLVSDHSRKQLLNVTLGAPPYNHMLHVTAG